MNKPSFFCRWLSYAFFMFVLVQPVLTRGAEDGGANSASPFPDLAVFPWGVPQFTDDALNTYPRPSWVLAAGMDGGLWITNDVEYGWQPGLDDESNLATNRLLIQLNRALVTSNLWIAVSASSDPDAVLLAGFYDADLLSVTDPIVLHLSDSTPWRTNRIDLSQFPSVSILSLSATNGLLRIFNSVLYRDSSSGATSPTFSASTNPALSDRPTVRPSDCLPPSAFPAVTYHLSPATFLGAPRTRYVDATAGADSNDGTVAVRVPATATGPKKTIAAALASASPGDTICVAAGTYPERVQFGNINMVLNGRVVLQ